MARENIETVSRLYDAFNRRDLAEEIKRLDPDFEWRFDERNLLQEPIRGRDNLRRFLDDQIDVLDVQLEAEELLEKGDHVVAILRVRVRGQASGAEADVRNAHLWTFEAGKAVRVQGYAEPGKALEAAGLER